MSKKKHQRRQQQVSDGYSIGGRGEAFGAEPLPDVPRQQMLFSIDKETYDSLGPQAQRILSQILPAFVEHFVEKNKHYGPKNANVLGPAGQFSDIWRKIGPLKRAMWDGAILTGEQPPEICRDLIGHSLLTIDMYEQGVDRRGEGIASLGA